MKRLTPIRAIRKYCLGCSGESWLEVKLCVIEDCPLYPYRFGKRPTTPHHPTGATIKTRKKATRVGIKSQEMVS